MINEIVTKYGITYIGEYKQTTDNSKREYTNLMMVSMKPVKLEEGGYNMVPALDIINVFTEGGNFYIPEADIIYENEVTYMNFIKLYEDTANMYKAAKEKHCAVSEKDNIDLSVQKKK